MQEIHFHNTLTAQKELFKSRNNNKVKIYSCGPTVYDYAHIGNFRTNVFQDLLRRSLDFFGYDVEHVMNITDVDDKTIAGSIRESLSLSAYTQRYTEAFFEDLDALRIKRPHHLPRATACIDDMLHLVQSLIDKGHAYESNGSVYFKIDTCKEYGKLSHKNLDQNIQGARIESDEYEKDNLSDFVLWKAQKEGEPAWTSPWGEGRPGWHIECSAMSMKYFGATFDIHTGGEDLVFPHHENEIAQSEAYSGEKYVNYWLHCKFLMVDGEKMSKSKGNFYTLRDLLATGCDPVSIRYLLLSHNYRHPLNFTLDGVEQAKKSVQRINECIKRVESLDRARLLEMEPADHMLSKEINEDVQKFKQFLADDLNIAQALAALFWCVSRVNKALDQDHFSKEAYDATVEMIRLVDAILDVRREENAIPEDIQSLAAQRQQARHDKNWAESDRLRDLLNEKGWMIKDSKDGFELEAL